MHKNVILFLTVIGLSSRAHGMESEPIRAVQTIVAGCSGLLLFVSNFLFENIHDIAALIGLLWTNLISISVLRINYLKAQRLKRGYDE